MRANIIIKAKQNGATIEGINIRGDFVETDTAYLFSYLESTNDNLIVLDKVTKSITVEKLSTLPRENYHSKLIFDLNKTNKCGIEVDEYMTFVDVKTTKMEINKTNEYMSILLEYYIADAFNEIEIIADWS